MTSRSHRLWLLIEARPTSWAQIREAEGYLERSGIEPELNSRLTKATGRPRRSDLHGFLIANYINAFQPSHRVYITAIASVLTGFDGEQRAHLGLVGWDDALAYDRAQRLLADVISALNPDDRGVIGNNVGLLDAPFQEIANSIGRSTIPQDLLIGTSVAIDGTAVESCGRLRVRRPALALDGYPGPSEEESDLRSLPPATVDLPRGPDGRTIYSADPDARGGHRSATSQHSAGPYNGYEMHLAVQTRDVIIQNPVDGAVLGPEVPQLILGFVLTEANAHRPRVCRYLLESVGRYRPTDDVIADRGMTMNPDEWQLPLREEGYRCHFDLMDYQRGVSPSGRALQLIDGWPMSLSVPKRLAGKLPVAPRGASPEVRRKYAAAFAERAQFRWSVHRQANAKGTLRFRGPFSAGRLRSQKYPETMRLKANTPLVSLPADWSEDSDGTRSMEIGELPNWQPTMFGTSAWFDAYMSRRQAVESANAGLQQHNASIGDRRYTRVFGRAKRTFLYAFTVAAYNRSRVRKFRQKVKLAAPADPRARDRANTGCTATPGRSTTDGPARRAAQGTERSQGERFPRSGPP